MTSRIKFFTGLNATKNYHKFINSNYGIIIESIIKADNQIMLKYSEV